jgi:hypothetical protein
MLSQPSPRRWNKMMKKSTTFTTIFHVKSATFITICKKIFFSSVTRGNYVIMDYRNGGCAGRELLLMCLLFDELHAILFYQKRTFFIFRSNCEDYIFFVINVK